MIFSPVFFFYSYVDPPVLHVLTHSFPTRRSSDLNAWGSPFFGMPFDWGVDISILPLTKFWNGHSDLVMGAIVVRTQHWEPLWRYIQRTSPSVTSQDRKSTRLNSSH